MSWHHRVPEFLALAVAIIFAYCAITYFSRDQFVPEFLDQGNVKKTQDTANSSYRQETNAVRPNGRFDAAPIQGVISPFRVNIWDSYIP
jgi:hypothetical protein